MKNFIIFLLSIFLFGCVTTTKNTSELQQAERYFEAGYYKKAMHYLLPLALKGNAKAQYAVGYMYYYGEGVAQDTDTGYFWIDQAAEQHYPPAQNALKLIDQNHAA